uniref:Uncharacterized protein n=1 Tax=Myripristis murdjan TaxID=586833 RepID=A0A667Y1S6_9TELE
MCIYTTWYVTDEQKHDCVVYTPEQKNKKNTNQTSIIFIAFAVKIKTHEGQCPVCFSGDRRGSACSLSILSPAYVLPVNPSFLLNPVFPHS